MDFNAKLIDTVSNHEPLYNQYLPDHKNRDRIDQHWKEVAAELGSSVELCKTRWSSLRTTYGKKHRVWERMPSGSASQAPEKWPYYRQLSFLDSFIRHRRTVDNLPDIQLDEQIAVGSTAENTSESSLQLESDSLESTSPGCYVKRKRTRERTDVQVDNSQQGS